MTDTDPFTNEELNRNWRPARHSPLQRFYRLLHFQFLALYLSGVIYTLVLFSESQGFFSWTTLLMLILFVGITRYIALPVFRILRGVQIPYRWRVIASYVMAGLLISSFIYICFPSVFSVQIPWQSLKGPIWETNKINAPLSGITTKHCRVRFLLIPYAQVIDISNTNNPVTLFESHDRWVSLLPGDHVFQFQYLGQSIRIPVLINAGESYLIRVNMQSRDFSIARQL